jgi:phosphatidylglycerol:prolipoprotein diacylglycerol transferase
MKKLGTFPHWAAGTVASGDGSPAYVRHRELFAGKPLGLELIKTNASLPVHPTQIYESLCGLLLLVLVLMTRKNLKFRGQSFLTFVFGYGFLRFVLEIVRDDTERGEYGPLMSEHILIPAALLLMAAAFTYGIALGIKNPTARMVARILAFVPPVVAYILLKPASFGNTIEVQLSTSQWIGFLTAILASFFYAKYWEDARRDPRAALALGDGVEDALQREAVARGEAAPAKEEIEEEEEDDEEAENEHDGEKGPVEDPAG